MRQRAKFRGCLPLGQRQSFKTQRYHRTGTCRREERAVVVPPDGGCSPIRYTSSPTHVSACVARYLGAHHKRGKAFAIGAAGPRAHRCCCAAVACLIARYPGPSAVPACPVVGCARNRAPSRRVPLSVLLDSASWADASRRSRAIDAGWSLSGLSWVHRPDRRLSSVSRAVCLNACATASQWMARSGR